MRNQLQIDLALDPPHRVNDPNLRRALQECTVCGQSWPCQSAAMELLFGREVAE
jgi:hypothetical protein